VVFFPNISPAKLIAGSAVYAPRDAWYESLYWLKDNSPEPFTDPDFYYRICQTPFKYPDTAYGVISWWDYGYLIIRVAHRPVVNDPGGGARQAVARFFTAQDEASANERINKLDSKYVIIDYDTTTRMFHAVATYAGSSEEEFFDVYYQAKKGKMVPVVLLYPEYYRSLAVRLYNFDGDEVTPQSSTVISYEEKVDRDGMRYRKITSLQSFPSYEEAEAYFLSQESENYEIVSKNPFISPVPLEALEHYELIYRSDSFIMKSGVGRISEVKIFEYTE
jgi:dolichyl-diphosphooligosaccharide--protein glycosyltransferase